MRGHFQANEDGSQFMPERCAESVGCAAHGWQSGEVEVKVRDRCQRVNAAWGGWGLSGRVGCKGGHREGSRCKPEPGRGSGSGETRIPVKSASPGGWGPAWTQNEYKACERGTRPFQASEVLLEEPVLQL
eukprot:EG_transcript_20411